MTPQHVMMLFQLIAFLFAISIHESAHAWTANRCGDPTARMLGRVTLNPIKHIDPVGTILLPAVALFTGLPVLGWAKPTPVNPRNFKNPVADDILTSVAGPISNFMVAAICVVLMGAVALTSRLGHETVQGIARGFLTNDSALVPLCLMLYALLEINVLLAVFNLIPVPPLDGSHVLRHFLSGTVLQAYDMVGTFGLIALVFFGGRFLAAIIDPFLGFFNFLITRF
jgi:Zn-dependent protease